MTVSTISYKPFIHLRPNLVWWYITMSKVKVTAKIQNVKEWLTVWYLLNHQTFCYQLGMLMHHYKPEYHTEKLVSYLQGQGHRKGLYDRNMTFYNIFWTTDPFATKRGYLEFCFEPVCLVTCERERRITVFKVTVTAKLQNLSECLSGWNLLKC